MRPSWVGLCWARHVGHNVGQGAKVLDDLTEVADELCIGQTIVRMGSRSCFPEDTEALCWLGFNGLGRMG